MLRHPQRSWAEVEDELRSLAAGVTDGDPVAPMVRWLYQQLDVAGRQFLRPLVVCPWPSFTGALAAQAVGVSEIEAERTVRRMVDCGLVASCGSGRYTIRASTGRAHFDAGRDAASQIRSAAAGQRASCALELGRPNEEIRFLEMSLRDHEADQRPADAMKVRQRIEACRRR